MASIERLGSSCLTPVEQQFDIQTQRMATYVEAINQCGAGARFCWPGGKLRAGPPDTRGTHQGIYNICALTVSSIQHASNSSI